MNYINNTQGVVYIPRDGSNPTITLKPGEEVDIPTSRAVKGLLANPPKPPSKRCAQGRN